MKIDLLYSREGISIDVPDGLETTVISKHSMVPLDDIPEELDSAFKNPVENPSLAEYAKGRKSACILVCDITRPVPNGVLLPPLIDNLVQAGIPKEDILILIATGMHRPNLGEELEEVIGSDEVVRAIRVENHFAQDLEAHANLGSTSDNVPILIDRRFMEADIRIAIGLVEPHFMAGYSGGRKVVAPGIAHMDTILNFHSPRFLEHPKADNCIIEGNPLHNQQIEIVRAIGDILALNVVIDEERRIGFLNFGALEAGHAEAVAFMRQYAEVKVGRRFNTVVTTSAGYPLDKTYYQTVKGMVGVLNILEPGGTVIIASACSEGMGSREFMDSQRLLAKLGPEGFLEFIEKRECALVDEWETEMLVKAMKAGEIKLYTTGLNEDDLKNTCVEHVDSIEQAVMESVTRHNDKNIAVIPEGPYVIPIYSAKPPSG